MDPQISTKETEAECRNWKINQKHKAEEELGFEARSLKPERSRGWSRDWKQAGAGRKQELEQEEAGTGTGWSKGSSKGKYNCGCSSIEQLMNCFGGQAYVQDC